MNIGDKYRALLYAINDRKERLERQIAELREPKDENNMSILDAFLYGEKVQMQQEIENLERWLNAK